MSEAPAPEPRRTSRFLRDFLSFVPHMRELGIELGDVGTGWVELVMPWREALLADPDYGIIASGAIFTLMDSAAGISVLVRRGSPAPHATLDLRVDYLRAPRPRATITGRAECYRLTRQIAFVRGIAHDGDAADPIANVAGTFMFTAAPPPA